MAEKQKTSRDNKKKNTEIKEILQKKDDSIQQ